MLLNGECENPPPAGRLADKHRFAWHGRTSDALSALNASVDVLDGVAPDDRQTEAAAKLWPRSAPTQRAR